MHPMDGGWFWGMHLFWWLFGFLFIASFFSMLAPVPRHKARGASVQILQRRYAAGELSTQEYEKLKRQLEHDVSPNRR